MYAGRGSPNRTAPSARGMYQAAMRGCKLAALDRPPPWQSAGTKVLLLLCALRFDSPNAHLTTARLGRYGKAAGSHSSSRRLCCECVYDAGELVKEAPSASR